MANKKREKVSDIGINLKAPMNQSLYAELCGTNRATISRHIKKGNLILEPSGEILLKHFDNMMYLQKRLISKDVLLHSDPERQEFNKKLQAALYDLGNIPGKKKNSLLPFVSADDLKGDTIYIFFDDTGDPLLSYIQNFDDEDITEITCLKPGLTVSFTAGKIERILTELYARHEIYYREYDPETDTFLILE